MSTASATATAPGAPEWSAATEILDALDRLQAPHKQKKITTILALVDARLAGRSEESVWKEPGTVARTNYHAKWKKDALFADVLATVHRAALRQQNKRATDTILRAQHILMISSASAATTLVKAMTSTDEQIVIRAALAVLDRAGLETATKTETHAVGPTPLDQWRRDVEQRRAAVDGMIADMDDDPEPAAGDDADEAGA